MSNSSHNLQESEPSPLLNEASRLYVEGKFDEAVREALKYVDTPDSVVSQDARRLAGLSEFQLGNYAQAKQYWNKVVETSKRPNDWFNLATSSTMSKDIELGRKAFDESLRLYGAGGEGFSTSVTMITYYYIRALIDAGEYVRAFEQLDTLTHLYTHTGVTDYTHLVASTGQSIPDFNAFIEAFHKIMPHIDSGIAKKWLDALRTKVDDSGKSVIDAVYS